MHILAIFALILFAGIIYAMYQSPFGRLILLGIGCWFLWTCWHAVDYISTHPTPAAQTSPLLAAPVDRILQSQDWHAGYDPGEETL